MSSMDDCTSRSNVTTPTNASTGRRMSAKARNAGPSRAIWPMKPRAMRLLDTAAR
jgi:hypothetical protein